MPVPQMIRTRWAAVGAALAVSLGAGGAGLIDATSPDGAATFVPITPCRLFDTRPAPNSVGGRTSPLGPDETYTVAGRGTVGNCVLPDAATGLALNVTAVGATQATFLTLFPAGADRPAASHLNPAPGTAPAPNSVTVGLSPAGQFSVFNRFGSVHALADVVGYYTDHHHDDRYYTKAQTDAAYVANAALDAALDARVPPADSLTLAGGAFTPAGGELLQSSSTACFAPDSNSSGMRHSVPLTTGSTITALSVRARNTSIYQQQFSLTLWAQRPGTANGEIVHAPTFTIAPGVSRLEARVALPTPERADAGEALYVSFDPGPGTHLCAVGVEFSRPG